MIDQIFLFFFLSERLFLPLFWRSKQRNNLLNLRPLLIPPFLNFYRWKIAGLWFYKDIRLTNRTAGTAWWTWRWLVQVKITPPIWPYLEEERGGLSEKIPKYSSMYVPFLTGDFRSVLVAQIYVFKAFYHVVCTHSF